MTTTIGRMAVAAALVAGLVASALAQEGTQRVTDESIASLVAKAKAAPNDPEVHYRLAVAYWYRACVPRTRACESSAGPPEMRAKNIQSGLIATDTALALRGDFIEVLIYKSLLLRGKAVLEPSRRDNLIKEADALVTVTAEILARRRSVAPGR